MTDYYVTKSGNDSNDGLSPTDEGGGVGPWLTVEKARATISTAGGHTVGFGDGTYTENSGSGYLYFNNIDYTSPVVFYNLTEGGTGVTIENVSGTYGVRIRNSSNMTWRDINFATGADASTTGVYLTGDTYDMTFQRCRFRGRDGQSDIALYVQNDTYDSLFEDCEIDGVWASHAGSGLWIVGTDGANVVGATTFRNCLFKNTKMNVVGQFCENVTFDNCAFVCNTIANAGCLIMGSDNPAVDQHILGLVVRGCIVDASSGTGGSHGVLLGGGVVSASVTGNRIYGGGSGASGWGFVDKSKGATVTGNLIVQNSMATITALLFKGCNYENTGADAGDPYISTYSHNTIYSKGANCIASVQDPTEPADCYSGLLRDNVVIHDGSAACWDMDNNSVEFTRIGTHEDYQAGGEGTPPTGGFSTTSTVGTAPRGPIFSPSPNGPAGIGTARSPRAIGTLDVWGRSVLGPDVKGAAYPQTDDPRNILRPVSWYAGER